MGGHCYSYFVPYQDDIGAALQTLRKREFEAGRYNPVIHFPFDGSLNLTTQSPSAKHRSIEDALEASDADGTRSILDMERVGTSPGWGTVVPLSSERLRNFFNTETPTREMILENMDFFEEIDRGQGIYIIAYKESQPSEIFFAGISYD